MNAGADPGIVVREHPFLPLPSLSFFPSPSPHSSPLLPLPSPPLHQKYDPLNAARGLGSAVSSASGVPSGARPKIVSGHSRSSCQKAAGSNHFEYSEVHVLQ